MREQQSHALSEQGVALVATIAQCLVSRRRLRGASASELQIEPASACLARVKAGALHFFIGRTRFGQLAESLQNAASQELIGATREARLVQAQGALRCTKRLEFG